MTQSILTREDVLGAFNGIAMSKHEFDTLTELADRLSPPAPEVDEATVWTGKIIGGYFDFDPAGISHAGRNFQAARTTLSELIASKDAERSISIVECSIDTRDGDSWVRDLMAGRSCMISGYKIAPMEKWYETQPELATLRAENERLKDTLNTLGTRWALRKAAERNTAEPERRLSSERAIPAGEVVRSAGPRSSDGSGNPNISISPPTIWVSPPTFWGQYPHPTSAPGFPGIDDVSLTSKDVLGNALADRVGTSATDTTPGTNAGAVEVTEADKELWETVWDSGCANEPLEIAKYRTEAEARGRLEALEEIKKWLRSPEGKGSDAGIDYADGFADQIERMMTGGK